MLSIRRLDEPDAARAWTMTRDTLQPIDQMSYICPVNSPTTRGSAALAALRARLADGTWALGDRLPGEHELAAELGVGRNTLREALRSLVNAGLLTARRGDGTYVIATNELDAALRRRVSSEEALMVLEVRGTLEVQAARLAAVRASDAELAALETLLDQRDAAAAGNDAAAFLAADLAWHAAIAEAARNPLLLDLYLGLDRPATYARDESEQSIFYGDHETLGTHNALMVALLARDPQRAAAAATHLIDTSTAALSPISEGLL